MRKQAASFEFRSLKNDLRFKIGIFIIYALFLTGLLSGLEQFISENKEIKETAEKTYRQWVGQGDKNPHSAAHYGLYAFKPAPLLLIFDKGLEDYLGRAVWLEAHNQNEVRISQVKDRGLTGRYGYLTVGYVWQLFIPLLIILLSFDSVNKEIETGTIRMLLSTNLKGSELLWAKVGAVFKLIMLFFILPMSVIMLAVMLLAGTGSTQLESIAIFLFILFLYAIYFLIWAIIAIYFSTRLKSAPALSVLIGSWILFGFLIPRISGTIADIISPAPSSFHFTTQVLTEREKGEDGTGSYEQFQNYLKEKILKEYGVDSIEQLPVSFAGYALMESENKDWKIYDKHYNEVNEIFRKQNKLVNAMNILSPVQTQKSLSAAFASTDIHNHNYFAAQAETHRRKVQTLLNEDQLKNGIGKERGYLASAELWKTIPQFTFQQQSFITIFKKQFYSIVLLFAWLAAGVFFLNRAGKSLRYSI